VDHAPVWLRLVVSAATPLLGLMLWIMVVDVVPANSPVVMLAAVGMVIGGLIALPRTRNAQSRAPARGRRAAR
jgi:ABC-type enterochelin transport system permease subunit